MNEFTIEQLSMSTAEDEHNYFTGQPEVMAHPNPNAILPPGIYRVVEGMLYRIVGGSPFSPGDAPRDVAARTAIQVGSKGLLGSL